MKVTQKTRSAVRRSLRVLACISLLPVTLSGADDMSEYRTFRSTDGAELEARIVECASSGVVSIRRRDGKLFKNVPRERFCREDFEFIKAWQKQMQAQVDNAEIDAEARIRITVLKGQDDAFNSYGDIDDRIIEFEPKVVIDSDELERTFPGVSGRLVIVGRGVVDKDAYVILSAQDFKIDISPRRKSRWEGNKFSCRYDPDYGGYDYEGYLVVLKDRSGRLIHVKGSKTAWEARPELLLKAKTSTGYDRTFEKTRSLQSRFGLPGTH